MASIIGTTLIAHVLVKPEDPVFDRDTPVTSENVAFLHPGKSALACAASALEARGFEVNFENEFTLLVSGSRSLFEKVFKSKVTEEHGVLHFNQDTFSIPEEMAAWIETVSFSEPPALFG